MKPAEKLTIPGNHVHQYHQQILSGVNLHYVFVYFEQEFARLWVIRGIFLSLGIKPMIETIID